MTSLDYIAEYSARKSPLSMTPPWRHPNALIRASYWKREVRVQSQILDGLGRDQSRSRDISLDAFADALTQYRSAIQAGWDLRAMERGNPVPEPRSTIPQSLENRNVVA
jgi:hypothetical protein